MKISKETTMFSKVLGDNIKTILGETTYNQGKLLAHLKGMKAGEFGWVELHFPCGYVSNTHFRLKEDGEPRFSNAYFAPSDIETVRRCCGDEVAELLLADHL